MARQKTIVRAMNNFSYLACDHAKITSTGESVKFTKDDKTYTRKAWVAGFNQKFVYMGGKYLKLSKTSKGETATVIDEYVEKR